MVIRQKLRELKKYKDVFRKLQLISEKFSVKVPCDEFIRMKQYIAKLLEHDESLMIETLPSIFQNLDEGAAIDIS
jgi:hypothetical protein